MTSEQKNEPKPTGHHFEGDWVVKKSHIDPETGVLVWDEAELMSISICKDDPSEPLPLTEVYVKESQDGRS